MRKLRTWTIIAGLVFTAAGSTSCGDDDAGDDTADAGAGGATAGGSGGAGGASAGGESSGGMPTLPAGCDVWLEPGEIDQESVQTALIEIGEAGATRPSWTSAGRRSAPTACW